MTAIPPPDWGNVSGGLMLILSLGCSVISVAFIIYVAIFFTYALLANLRFTCRE
jgi:hypothetical protein